MTLLVELSDPWNRLRNDL